jgi:hypothetical protein
MVDASLGNDFRVTIAGNRTMGTPSNPTNGEQIISQITQGTGAPWLRGTNKVKGCVACASR